MKRAFLILASFMALAACDLRPEHAEWQMQCVESHTDAYPIPVTVSNPDGTMSVQIQMQYTDVCDRREPVCVAGKDGSTECPAR